MKVTAIETTKVDLTPHCEEFEILFTWTRKRGVNKSYWFTPSGKCKLWIGGLNNEHIGKIQPKVYKELVKQLKENKTDIFNDGDDRFYTTTGGNAISEIRNGEALLTQARKEWEERKYIEFWVEDDRILEPN